MPMLRVPVSDGFLPLARVRGRGGNGRGVLAHRPFASRGGGQEVAGVIVFTSGSTTPTVPRSQRRPDVTPGHIAVGDMASVRPAAAIEPGPDAPAPPSGDQLGVPECRATEGRMLCEWTRTREGSARVRRSGTTT